ncbi:MAG: GAF domain-containing protein [Bacteroidetes bacterium]|nr:GAF domain-containing protein [Bacteroidota bacterium]MBU1117283.1 GAF domain-containing protein [Bacteroidota bacterium]MBU1797377.1 GAF domain-containing protein [Bacteroidota bacterium]
MDPIVKEELRNNKLFQNIDFDSLIFNDIAGSVRILNQGELLYRQGERDNAIYLIVHGEINLIPSQFNSVNNSIIYSDNDFFGINEFISDMPRSETAIAIRETYLIVFSKVEINELLKQSDEILTAIYSSSEQTENNLNINFNIGENEKKDIKENEVIINDENNFSDDLIDENEINENVLLTNEPELKTDVQSEMPIIENNMKENELKSTHIGMTFDQLDRINKAAHLVNSNVKIDDVLKNIVDVSVSICEADRGTLYLVDKSKNELWSKVLQGNEPRRITLKIGDGFAGWAAANKEIVNIKEASSDSRFNSTFDKESGYTTKSVLCFPIKNKNDDVLGVLQLLNSKNGIFSNLDENFLYALSTNAALALQNADLVEQLLKTERISSLGKMANFLIEDIKKPILVSKRYTEHLKKKELSPDVINVVDMLLEQLNNIADLVQSTSNYSEGKSVLRSNIVNLSEALNEFIERVDSYVQSMKCKIVTNYEADVRVNIDSKEFYQGFKHIIKNACEAMPNGGDISLFTKIVNDKVSLIIKDNGVGIPIGFNEKIFEPFMSYGKRTGTGLGLSVTKKIVEEHSGSISATSDLGNGTTITIILPVA